MFRIGLGTDTHKFKAGRKLVLGGIAIPHSKGLEGHSDADVVLHAVADALLGALALGDLGTFFPADEKNRSRSSSEILTEVVQLVWDRDFVVENLDLVVMAEEPRLGDYKLKMAEAIGLILDVSAHQVGIKATTCEGMGFIGRGEGIFAQAVVLLRKRMLE